MIRLNFPAFSFKPGVWLQTVFAGSLRRQPCGGPGSQEPVRSPRQSATPRGPWTRPVQHRLLVCMSTLGAASR